MKKILKYAGASIAVLFAAFLLFLSYVAIEVDPNDYKPQIVAFVRDETGRTPNLEGKIGLKLFPRIGLNLGKASLSGPEGKGQFASMDNAMLDMAWLPLLRGSLEVDRIAIDGLHVRLVRHSDGTTNYDDLAGGKAGGARKPEFDIGGITVANSSVSLEDEKTGSKRVFDGISLATGRLKEGVHTGFSLGLVMKDAAGESKLSLKSGLLPGSESYRLDGIDLEFSGGKHAIAVKGEAEIDMEKRSASADLSGKFDDSHVRAKLAVKHFASPAYRFDVGIDRLDADRYLAGSRDSGPGKPFDLSFLRKLDASGNLAIGALKVYGLQLSNVALGIHAADSRLNLDPIRADLYQGKSAGSAVVEALAVPKFRLKENLSGISVGPLIRDMTKKDILEGRGAVAVDLKASGNLVGDLRKSLAGKASLRLTDGAVRGIDMAAALRGIQSKMGGAKSGAANASEKTDFSELSATFDIRNGVAHNSDLAAKSPLFRLGGEGDIDIGRSALNYLARVSVVATLQGQGGADLSSLRGVTVPVRISGPFDSLHYSLDIASMASGALKAKVEQQKTEVKDKVKERLLKGLFGN